MITPEPTEQEIAAASWTQPAAPCGNCCGPWIGFVLGKARRAELDTSPEISLSSDEPAYECVVQIKLGGCDFGDTSCQEVYEDELDAAEAEKDDAQAALTAKESEQAALSDDLSAKIATAATALDAMEPARLTYSALQRDLTAARIEEETYTRRGDTAAADAAAAQQAAIQDALAIHEYHSLLSDYTTAASEVEGAYSSLYQGQRELDIVQREYDVANFKHSCAEHNLSAATSTDVEMWYVFGFDGIIARRTSTERREGYYKIGLDLSTRSGEDGISQLLPLPQEEVTVRFEWREVFIPADDSEYTYSLPITEDVVADPNTQTVYTPQHFIAAPLTEGVYNVVTLAGRPVVSVVSETMSAMKNKYGFPAYKHADGPTMLYTTETASGPGFSGSRTVDEIGNVTGSFSESVPDSRKSAVWPPAGQWQDTKPETYTATQRNWGDKMVMTLSGLVPTSEIEVPVDDHVESVWGTDPPEGLFSASITHPHRYLFEGETRYSRRKSRIKFQVAIPSSLPFDITITVHFTERTYTWATGEWASEDKTREIIILAGNVSAIESSWTEYDPEDGTMVMVSNVEAAPHPHVWTEGADVSIAS